MYYMHKVNTYLSYVTNVVYASIHVYELTMNTTKELFTRNSQHISIYFSLKEFSIQSLNKAMSS